MSRFLSLSLRRWNVLHREFQTGVTRLKKDGDSSDISGENKDPSIPKDLVETSDKNLTRLDQNVLTHKAKNFEVADNYKNPQGLIKYHKFKPLESSYKANRPIENPVERAIDQLTGKKKTKFLKEGFDAYYDIVIIGGGVIGCSIAFHLASRIHEGHKICVIERDPSVMQLSDLFVSITKDPLLNKHSIPINVSQLKFQPTMLM